MISKIKSFIIRLFKKQDERDEHEIFPGI